MENDHSFRGATRARDWRDRAIAEQANKEAQARVGDPTVPAAWAPD